MWMKKFTQPKQNPSVAPTGSDFARLFKSGSSSVPPDATLFSLIRPINHDGWVVKKTQQFEIGASFPQALNTYSGTTTSSSSQSFTLALVPLVVAVF